MSSPLPELLSTPIPEKLWHYTSVDAFLKIVGNKNVFATDVRFMNDREEFVHARQLADEMVKERPELDAEGFPDREFFAKTVALGFGLKAEIFVACFTAAEDQLGQWRAYSHGSAGVSLGFDLRGIRPLIESGSTVCFAPCVYSLARKRKLVWDAVRHVRDELASYRRSVFEEACRVDPTKRAAADKEEVVTEFLKANPEKRAPFERFAMSVARSRFDCVRVAALLKDSAFEEEKEWRLVLPTLLDQQEKMQNPPQFRAGRTTPIPYIDHRFADKTPFPLVDVILGPGSDENAVFAAERFLKLKGFGITPRVSAVPYRPW